MAEAAPASQWESKILCRYFLHGLCREGTSCRFSHDMGAPQSSVCKYYLKGSCTYGDRCRYDHIKKDPKKNSESSGSQISQNHSKPDVTGPKHALLTKEDSTCLTSRMVTLKKHGQSADSGLGEELANSPTVKNPVEWVKAAEFIPGQIWKGSAPVSYLDAAQTGVDCKSDEHNEKETATNKKELCPYATHGVCHYGDNCVYIHGDQCDLCGKAVLHPGDSEQQEKHKVECIKEHEENMELSFAVARSKEKVCGICMDIVWEKNPPAERRFGILSDCSHIFCLSCIRKWRAAKQFENKIVRSCPECRTKSDFVTPSKYWVEDKDDKLKLIGGYKSALSAKSCKYFDQGRGECPFNENCFYLHAYPDGRKASPKPIRRRRRADGSGELDLLQQIILWDFFEDRSRRLPFALDWDDDLDYFFHVNFWDSSDEESDYSDLSLYGFP